MAVVKGSSKKQNPKYLHLYRRFGDMAKTWEPQRVKGMDKPLPSFPTLSVRHMTLLQKFLPALQRVKRIVLYGGFHYPFPVRSQPISEKGS